MALALACIAAVVCGAMLARAPGLVAAGLGVGLSVVALAWLRSLATTDPRTSEASRWLLAGALLVALGLVRGASVGPPEPPRVPERGWVAGSLRELEVVGASSPGVRCELELRNSRVVRGRPLSVSAPPEHCPLSQGQRVAVMAQALAGTWRDALDPRRDTRDLGRAPVLWRRPSPEPRGLERIRVGYWHRIAVLRQRAWESTRGDPSAGLVVAVGLGLRSALAPEQRDRLRAAGLGHLIAVSGLHVAVAALGLQAIARRGVVLLGGSPRWACVIAWIPLWAYVGLTGAAASAIRAALMLTGIDLAVLVGRPRHAPTLLASAAAAMLVWHPSWLLDPGFALSLAAMAAIVSAPRELGVLALSWRITWATAPLSVLWFDAAPLHGLLGNAVVLPLFALLMPLALVAVLVPGPIGALALSLAKLGATPILDIAAALAKLPSAGSRELLLLALLGLALHLRLRSAASGLDDPPPAWLPPKLACVLAVVVAAASLLIPRIERRELGPVEFDWVALGSVHSRALLVGDPSAPASACLYRPIDSTATWLGVLELLEVRRLARVDAKLPSTEPGAEGLAPLDPGARALLERLERAGIERGEGDACRAPDPARVRAGLRACKQRQGGRGRALVRSLDGVISCRIDERWVVADEIGSEP